MPSDEIEIAVFEGPQLIHRQVCTAIALPDGGPGVLWRGLPYSLRPDNSIDVAVTKPEAAPAAADGEAAAGVALLSGGDLSWVLVQGLPAQRDRVQAALRSAALVVRRSGRWLGDPVAGQVYDWFLCCEGPLDDLGLARLLGAAPHAEDPAARVVVLEQRLADLRAELVRLQDGLRRAAAAPRPRPEDATATADAARAAEAEAALQDALAQLHDLQTRLDAAAAPPPAPARAVTSLEAELLVVLAAFRPDIGFLRDSLLVAVGAFRSRTAFYRALQELPAVGGRPHGQNWKLLRGADRWWERHVSTGQDDSGRAYARFDASARRWTLLLGWKVEQTRDIDWLRRQG